MVETVKIRTTYVIFTKVSNMYEYAETGWFVHFEGSRESIFLGKEKPDLEEGDLIRIGIERMSR